MSDVPRSLQSWDETIQTVVLTSDVFHLSIKKFQTVLKRNMSRGNSLSDELRYLVPNSVFVPLVESGICLLVDVATLSTIYDVRHPLLLPPGYPTEELISRPQAARPPSSTIPYYDSGPLHKHQIYIRPIFHLLWNRRTPQPKTNPTIRKIRSKVAFGTLFPAANNFSWVGIGFIWQTY